MYCIVMMLISSVGTLAVWSGEPPEPHWETGNHPIAIARNESMPQENWFTRLFINNWYRWDTPWYMIIAVFGYDSIDHSVGFQPLYPLLIRLVHNITGISYLVSALLITRVSCLVALILFYLTTKDQFNSEVIARKATILMLVFPVGFFLFAGYTEALYLALALASLNFFSRKKWFWAGFTGGLSSLARIQGVVLSFPLFWMFLSSVYQIRWQDLKNVSHFFLMIKEQTRESFRSLLNLSPLIAALMPALSVICYSICLKFSGMSSIFSAHSYWHRGFVYPWEGMYRLIHHIMTLSPGFFESFELFLLITFIVVIVIGLKMVPFTYSLYNLMMLIVFIMVGKEGNYLSGFSRYLLIIFPIFMVLGKIIKNRTLFYAIISVSFCLNLFYTWLFVSWFWVA